MWNLADVLAPAPCYMYILLRLWGADGDAWAIDVSSCWLDFHFSATDHTVPKLRTGEPK